MAIHRCALMRGPMCPSVDAILLLRAKSLLPRLQEITILWPANADAATKTANIAKNRAAFALRLHQERNFCKRGEVLGGLLSQRYFLVPIVLEVRKYLACSKEKKSSSTTLTGTKKTCSP